MFIFFYSRMEQSQTTGKMKPCNILGKSASPWDTTRFRFFASTQLSVWNRNWAQKSSSSFISNIRWSHPTCTSWKMSRCVSNYPKPPSGITTTYRHQFAVVHTFFSRSSNPYTYLANYYLIADAFLFTVTASISLGRAVSVPAPITLLINRSF
jgi:hypothetical protein